MKLWKLTDSEGKTFGGCQWGENVTHGPGELEEGDGPLCSGHWYHAYQDPVLAVLMNTAHANFKDPRLWEAEGEIGQKSPDKVGCKELTTIHEIPLPKVTATQRRAFGILAALEVYDDPDFVKWTNDWLSGKDRTAAAAADAWAAAWAAVRAAAWAADAAAWAAVRAAWAADATKIDLVSIAHKVMEY